MALALRVHVHRFNQEPLINLLHHVCNPNNFVADHRNKEVDRFRITADPRCNKVISLEPIERLSSHKV